jgi:ketosteroid isomerase-like protein
MKPLLVLAIVFGSVSLLVFGQEKHALSPVEDTVLKLEQQWEEALIKSDTNALDKLYAETIIYTHSSGSVDSKSTYIQAIKSGATRYASMKRDDIKVSVYGNTAVVTCHWDVHVQARGTKIDMNARYLHVYVQQKDGWKMVAHQSTRIAP